MDNFMPYHDFWSYHKYWYIYHIYWPAHETSVLSAHVEAPRLTFLEALPEMFGLSYQLHFYFVYASRQGSGETPA